MSGNDERPAIAAILHVFVYILSCFAIFGGLAAAFSIGTEISHFFWDIALASAVCGLAAISIAIFETIIRLLASIERSLRINTTARDVQTIDAPSPPR